MEVFVLRTALVDRSFCLSNCISRSKFLSFELHLDKRLWLRLRLRLSTDSTSDWLVHMILYQHLLDDLRDRSKITKVSSSKSTSVHQPCLVPIRFSHHAFLLSIKYNRISRWKCCAQCARDFNLTQAPSVVFHHAVWSGRWMYWQKSKAPLTHTQNSTVEKTWNSKRVPLR